MTTVATRLALGVSSCANVRSSYEDKRQPLPPLLARSLGRSRFAIGNFLPSRPPMSRRAGSR